jgi:DNA-binding NtrC family response regulator
MGNTITLPNSTQVAPFPRKRPRLRLLYTPADGIVKSRVFSLPVGRTWLGRELPPEREGITIPGDTHLSGVHALIKVAPNDYHVRITDVGSKNGTFVGRTRIPGSGEGRSLQDGNLVRAGNTFLLLRGEPTQTVDAEISSFVGVSLAARELRARLHRLAQEPVPVLLCGETGTGKEVVARTLHQLSRRQGDFVALNCAAVPLSLAESELFGHAEHSFTGAHARQGAFRRADRGTLLLDEIGDMPPEVQAKLLRVLEERTLTPVGGDRPLPLDVKIIAATNHDLRADVERGTFRSDLHARLAHIQIDLPPLRSRREDILLLLEHASAEAAQLLTPDLIQDLLLYDWPENVRELNSVATRLRIDGISDSLLQQLRRSTEPAKVQVSTEVSQIALPPPSPSQASPTSSPPAERSTPRPYRLPVPSKEQLVTLLRKHLGTVKHVAEALKCSRKQVQRWLELHGLNADDFRQLPE